MAEPAEREPSDGLSQAQLAYVEELASIMTASGVQRMPSRVFAALLISQQGSMTAAELAAALRVSPAAVSTAVRWLDQIGMVSRRSVPGSRREHYVVDSDSLVRLIVHDTRALSAWIAGFDKGLEVVVPGSAPAHRLTELQEFFAFLVSEMDGVLQRWQERNAQPSPNRSARNR